MIDDGGEPPQQQHHQQQFPDHLAHQLSQLEATIPQLLAEHGQAEHFWPAFAGEADAIVDAAGPHSEEAAVQVARMLECHGLAN